MKDLPKLKENQYMLLMYIKEVAIENLRSFRCDEYYAVCSIIDIMLDAYKSEKEKNRTGGPKITDII